MLLIIIRSGQITDKEIIDTPNCTSGLSFHSKLWHGKPQTLFHEKEP